MKFLMQKKKSKPKRKRQTINYPRMNIQITKHECKKKGMAPQLS